MFHQTVAFLDVVVAAAALDGADYLVPVAFDVVASTAAIAVSVHAVVL